LTLLVVRKGSNRSCRPIAVPIREWNRANAGGRVAPETHNTAAAVPSTRMYLVRPETPDVESIDVTRLNLLKTGWFWTPDGRCASLG